MRKIITFHLNSVGRGFNFGQKCHKIVEIMFLISVKEELEAMMEKFRKKVKDKKRC